MALSTYSELQAAVADWLLRADLAPVIPTFIAMAEARMNRDTRLHVRQGVVRASLPVSGQFTALPADFRAMVAAESSTGRPLQYLPPQQVDALRYQQASGETRFYSISGTDLELVPEDTDTLAITYQRTVPALSVSAPTNWLLDAAPDLYLYAALCESAPYLKEDERIGVWEQQYNSRLSEYRATSDAETVSGSPLLVRGPVIG
jgi:hypothetical protein